MRLSELPAVLEVCKDRYAMMPFDQVVWPATRGAIGRNELAIRIGEVDDRQRPRAACGEVVYNPVKPWIWWMMMRKVLCVVSHPLLFISPNVLQRNLIRLPSHRGKVHVLKAEPFPGADLLVMIVEPLPENIFWEVRQESFEQRGSATPWLSLWGQVPCIRRMHSFSCVIQIRGV